MKAYFYFSTPIVILLLLIQGFCFVPVIAQNIEWIRQFGTADSDLAWDICADVSGVYVSGSTSGTLPGQNFTGVSGHRFTWCQG